jgi:hypothetical protein
VKGPEHRRRMQTVCMSPLVTTSRRPPYVCECKPPLTVNSVPHLYQPGIGDPHKDIFPTTVVVGVTIYRFSPAGRSVVVRDSVGRRCTDFL